MKRILVLSVVLGLIFGAVASAEAGKKKKSKTPPPYTMEARYDNPAIGTAGAGAGTPSTFASNSTNTFMSVEIADDNSPTPYGDFSWDTDGDGINDTGHTVCGTEAKDLQVPPNTTIAAFMWALPSPFCPGFSTSGTIKVTFSAVPSS